MNFVFENRIHLWSLLGCGALFFVLFELVRRNRIQEKYSLLWFCTALVLTVLALQRSWLEAISKVLGIYYPPSALFLLLVAFLLVLLVHFSTVVSKLIGDKQRLTQEIALLERRVRLLESNQNTVSQDLRSGSPTRSHS